MYNEDLSLNNKKWLIYHKTQTNQTNQLRSCVKASKKLRVIQKI